jgi:hypothetical protein
MDKGNQILIFRIFLFIQIIFWLTNFFWSSMIYLRESLGMGLYGRALYLMKLIAFLNVILYFLVQLKYKRTSMLEIIVILIVFLLSVLGYSIV